MCVCRASCTSLTRKSGLQHLYRHTKRKHYLSIKYPVPDSFPNSSAMRTMASDAEDILEELDSIIVEMRTNPTAEIVEEFLDDNLMRLDTLMNDVRAFLKQFFGWNWRYKEEEDATLKQLVDEEVSQIDLPDLKAGDGCQEKSLPNYSSFTPQSSSCVPSSLSMSRTWIFSAM